MSEGDGVNKAQSMDAVGLTVASGRVTARQVRTLCEVEGIACKWECQMECHSVAVGHVWLLVATQRKKLVCHKNTEPPRPVRLAPKDVSPATNQAWYTSPPKPECMPHLGP
ncbi:hypothetical protein BDV93DRAFT_509699 [Ceratobasidium sp. AG-I]|nr:hypothetical protein BDV93DRAFT_509699 [Ceratobasidium sp. AG-I]